MRTDSNAGEKALRSPAARARRDQIIQSAAEVVAEVGYANASTARIAARAGISKGVITYHFESKDEIMRQVALRLFERCAAQVETRVSTAATPTDQVRAWVGAELEFFAAHRVEYLAMNEVMANHRDTDFSRTFEDEVVAETRHLAEFLAQGQQCGEFRAFDTESVAYIILRCKDGVLDFWAHNPDQPLSAHAETLLDFIDHAITARNRPMHSSLPSA
ncbi:TetR/AcrR family transcriptional regulator [Actinomycetaceae bacterium L2_0104]